MEKLILDTSVLVKLFAPDERDSIVDNLLLRYSQNNLTLITLDIGVYELANTLMISKKATASTVFDNISDILRIKERLISLSSDLIKKSLLLMEKFNLTIYDSAFVAAAELERIPLLTADYKYHRKLISKHILHYKELHLN